MRKENMSIRTRNDPIPNIKYEPIKNNKIYNERMESAKKGKGVTNKIYTE